MPWPPKRIEYNLVVLTAPFTGPAEIFLIAAWENEKRADRDRNKYSKCLHGEMKHKHELPKKVL
jgi:hypothetical protein